MKKKSEVDKGLLCIALYIFFCLAYTFMVCYLIEFTFYDSVPANRIRNLALAAPGGVLFFLTALKIKRRK